MKHSAFLMTIALTATVLLASSCDVKTTHTKRHPKVTKSYSHMKPFESIYIDDFCEVTYQQGDSTKVEVSYTTPTDPDDLDIVNQDGRLSIAFKASHKLVRISDKDIIKVDITTPDLIEVNMKGAGKFRALTPIDTDTLRLKMNGAGSISFGELVCDQLIAELEGVGKIALGPITAQKSLLRLIGVGKMEAAFLESGSIDCQLKGVGKIKLKGSADSWNGTVLGTGKIDSKELEVKNQQ